jgi:hypothetical protein
MKQDRNEDEGGRFQLFSLTTGRRTDGIPQSVYYYEEESVNTSQWK